jgi:hypothetical protein
MINLQSKELMVKMEKYYMKTRGLRIDQGKANLMGIKRIYNYTSDIDFMDSENLEAWSNGLFNSAKGEAIIIESALKEVHGVSLYVMSCIVFYTIEQSNVYYLRNIKTFKQVDGFLHLLN